uniref:Uncharacterized protein n=1 Tax=Timema tahoe TaxID=61484 RepID=A0A7R9IDL8_9NEOP|nr:unnamed protein product [Timema tahoe]
MCPPGGGPMGANGSGAAGDTSPKEESIHEEPKDKLPFCSIQRQRRGGRPDAGVRTQSLKYPLRFSRHDYYYYYYYYYYYDDEKTKPFI